MSGNYQGREAITAFFYKLMELTGGSMRLIMDDVVGDEGRAVMFWQGPPSGRARPSTPRESWRSR